MDKQVQCFSSNIYVGYCWQCDKRDTVLFAPVFLSLGKPLVVIGGLDPIAVEEQQHCRQEHQEGKQQPHHQPDLTCGDMRTCVLAIISLLFFFYHCLWALTCPHPTDCPLYTLMPLTVTQQMRCLSYGCSDIGAFS